MTPGVQPSAQKYISFRKPETVLYLHPSRARYRGRFAIVTKRGAGCDGRCWYADDARQCVRSSRVVLSPRRWGQALSMMIDKVTGANKPDTPGRARSKP